MLLSRLNRGDDVAVDLSGGIASEREFVFPAKPDEPEMRESVNAWIWDGGDDVGMPRIGVEAVADQWDDRELQLNIAYADGRVFLVRSAGAAAHDPIAGDGRARHFGGGPLSFELVEPFAHWRMRFDGLAFASTSADQIAGRFPEGEPDTPMLIEIDLFGAVPPWENGAMLPEAKRVLEEQDEGALMGGPRYEQLSRASGTLQVGDAVHAIDGGALRIRRQGVRRLGTFRGHAWQSALFPSGRGFGYIVYPERDDGLPTYNEGYVFDGDGELIPAWVVDAPWLRTLQHRGQDVSVVLETARGTTRIEAESLVSCFMVMGGVGTGTEGFPVLQQAITRYTWDGETANGMMERSMPSNLVEA
jgi:hypothetical protein